MIRKQPKATPFKISDKILLGSYYMLIRLAGDYSLQYLDYITKIIGKSCKSVSSKDIINKE